MPDRGVAQEVERLGVIRGPELAANFAFGDEDGKALYLTAWTRTGLYRIRLNFEGTRPCGFSWVRGPRAALGGETPAHPSSNRTHPSGIDPSERLKTHSGAAPQSPLVPGTARSIHLRDVCTDFVRSSALEWLEANGIGGWAGSTVSGRPAARSHS